MSNFERVVHEFLERRLSGECLDTIQLTPGQPERQRADWLLFERQVIVEVKTLVDDREDSARAVLTKWRRQFDWPIVNRESGIQDILRIHPQGRRVNQEIFAAVTSSIDRAFEKANRQIRETKRLFDIPDAQSLLVFVNESVDILDPKVMVGRLWQLFAKKTRSGSPRFPDIDSILILTQAHFVLGPDGKPRSIIIWVEPPSAALHDPDSSLGAFIMEEWAAFIMQPLEQRGLIQKAEEFDALQLNGRKVPMVL